MGRSWEAFRQSALWKVLKKSPTLRSALYLCIELRRSLHENRDCQPLIVNGDFEKANDPWHYESSPMELARFRRQEALLGAATFSRGLEIGCAEGRFTETLAARCQNLLVLDIAPLALQRAMARRPWSPAVEFHRFDLRLGAIPGHFDLIVAAGVVEYFPRRNTLLQVRNKLSQALSPRGLLLVTTTRGPAVVEDSWWSNALPRGRRVHDLIAASGELELVSEDICPQFCISLYRKRS